MSALIARLLPAPLGRRPASRFLSALALFLALALSPQRAAACTVSAASTNLGSVSSYSVASTAQQGSGSSGLQCDVALALLATHYVALRVDASTFLLTGPSGQTIPFVASLAQNGTPLTIGTLQNLSSTTLLSLFSGTNNSIPIYFRTTATSALRAGTYTGFLDVRWFYSVCTLGVAVCLAYDSSPGFVRPLLGTPTNWGTGTAVRISITLVVQNDCIITAPTAAFGSAPLVGSFNPITRTILIRCSAGTAYTVGLDDGSNAASGLRRMRAGTTANYLQYEIYKTASSTDRWGATGSARRSSASADSNAGTYDSLTSQGYTYRAALLPGQVTPPAGAYSDTIRIDVAF
ncbi:spore coat protein U-like protein [Novosphingobium sp. PhB55]|uniref:Csu type fimbrial protein n=1 Tax=Novosphingobium sp. PhB55 TaxID=2485106 RepID=UPI001064ACF4|nr:spore coat U domain-containing protein [Novosphingobium sp. PhB55]TDW61820.1 spore coat protein U-like protein [Novosphingobium sp. PhB55]